MMKLLVAFALSVALVVVAESACTVHTVQQDGRTLTCKTCCEAGSTCHTVCF